MRFKSSAHCSKMTRSSNQYLLPANKTTSKAVPSTETHRQMTGKKFLAMSNDAFDWKTHRMSEVRYKVCDFGPLKHGQNRISSPSRGGGRVCPLLNHIFHFSPSSRSSINMMLQRREVHAPKNAITSSLQRTRVFHPSYTGANSTIPAINPRSKLFHRN